MMLWEKHETTQNKNSVLKYAKKFCVNESTLFLYVFTPESSMNKSKVVTIENLLILDFRKYINNIFCFQIHLVKQEKLQIFSA